MNNWFGMKSHPADQLMNWRDNDPTKTAKILRAAYDRIVLAYPKSEEDLKLLVEAARDNTRQDFYDDAAGENL